MSKCHDFCNLSWIVKKKDIASKERCYLLSHDYECFHSCAFEKLNARNKEESLKEVLKSAEEKSNL